MKIFNGIFGSHLYGLNTADSDHDYKGVYMPTKSELIFGDYEDSIEKQTAELDTSFYAVGKFANMLSKCDTVSIDMLHTPVNMTITKSNLWNQLRTNRSDIYCKDMRGILGYVKTMASKYGNKIQRYEEMQELYQWLNVFEKHVRISETTIPEEVQRRNFKYITYTPKKEDIIANIDVCGARHQITASVEYFRDALKQKLERYGKRTKIGSTSKGDWKSLSHALRVLIQLEEIIDTRDLIFPLVRVDEIMEVKLGQVPQDEVLAKINDYYDITIEKLNASDLPIQNNMTRIKAVIMNEYN